LTEKKRPRKAKPPARRVRKEAPSGVSKGNCIIAVRLRGEGGVAGDVRATLDMLRLSRKHNAILIYKRPDALGMLRKAKDYVTWGEADKEVLSVLFKKRCRPQGANELTARYLKERLQVPSIERLVQAIERAEIPLSKLREAGISPVFRLHPPKGGFKGALKRSFADGGELGDRGAEITSLISRMI